MKNEFLKDYYKSLEDEVNSEYVNSLKKLIEDEELNVDSLESLIKEVF